MPDNPPCVVDYKFGRHIADYLNSLIDSSGLTDEERAVSARISVDKFPRTKAAWINSRHPISRSWFAADSGNYEALNAAAAADRLEYESVKDLVEPPTFYIECFKAAVGRRVPLPSGMSEPEAVQYVAGRSTVFRCCLAEGGTRTYLVEPDGSYVVDQHFPQIKITKDWIIVTGISLVPANMVEQEISGLQLLHVRIRVLCSNDIAPRLRDRDS